MPKLFISYRYSISTQAVDVIYEALSTYFGEQDVFAAVRSVKAGQSYGEEIDRSLRQADVFLLVIGEDWHKLADGNGSKLLAKRGDWVRREILAALSLGIRVIPVLTRGASFPRRSDLPRSLREISKLHYLEIDEKSPELAAKILLDCLEYSPGHGPQPSTKHSARRESDKCEMIKAPKKIDIKLNLHVFEIAGVWEPNDTERIAAWEIYIELITRVSVVPLAADQGLLREALTSLYSLFGTTREVLRRHGPETAAPKRDGQYNLGYLAVAILNFEVRPLLSAWHPLLEEWEAKRPADVSRREHEQAWARGSELRVELANVRQSLAEYAELLATACGVPSLVNAIPQQQPGEPDDGGAPSPGGPDSAASGER